MTKRGRPPYPNILTPREFEVLELLREGLSNPEIAERLGISRDGAKYHVSEILTKLGVESRDEAARWQPEETRPWWAGAFAPIVLPWKKVSAALQGAGGVAARTVAVGVLAVAIGGLGLLAVLLYVQQQSDEAESPGLAEATGDARDNPEESLAVPAVSAIRAAIETRNVEALLELMDWQPQGCGSPQGMTDSCPDGVSAGTELPMINTGDTVQYWLTEDTVREQLAELLNAEPLELRYAAQTTASPYLLGREAIGDVYLLGFEGSAREVSSWGSLTALTGLFLNVDSGDDRPIISLSPLTRDWSASQQAELISDSVEGGEIAAIID